MANLLIPPILPFGRMTDRLGGVQPAGRQDSFGDRCVSSRWYNHDLTGPRVKESRLDALGQCYFRRRHWTVTAPSRVGTYIGIRGSLVSLLTERN